MSKILVVDDEEIICRRLKKLLELDNYSVATAADGKKALQTFKKYKPEIALVDIKLPGMDGIELLKRLKQLSGELEVIIFTGHGGVETAIEAMKLGAFSYIQKPIEYDELVIEIKRALSKQELQKKIDTYVKNLEYAVEAKNNEIAERKKAEQRINEQRTFLNNIIESLTHPFYVLDANNYTVTTANSATKIDNNNKNVTCYMFTHQRRKPCTGRGIKCPLRQVKKKKMPVTVEHVHKLKDGSTKYVEVHAFPILDEHGKVIQVIEYVIDITERKRAEELERAKAIAEQANRIKTQFLANVSHEIRTPLNAIVGFTDLLKKTKITTTQSEYINTIQQSSEDLLHLINDILDISKIEAHHLEIKEIVFNLKELIDNSIKIVRPKLNPRRVKFVFSYANDIPRYFKSDPARIKQIVTNLLDNVVKFTEKGSIELMVKGSTQKGKQKKRRQKIIITLKDTGIGIPLARQDEIFKPFTQGDASATRKYGGSGLGLYIIKVLIEKMGGTIRLRSKQGKGSIFTVCLELKSAPAKGKTDKKDKADRSRSSKQPTKGQEDHKQAAANLSISGTSVIVAEDSPVNQRLIKLQLESFGCNVDIVATGQEVINKIKHNDFDICLMDVQMPVVNGLEATKTIRSSLKNSIPIIALTASAMKGDAQKCLDCGMNDFIAKPIDHEILKTKIYKLLH